MVVDINHWSLDLGKAQLIVQETKAIRAEHIVLIDAVARLQTVSPAPLWLGGCRPVGWLVHVMRLVTLSEVGRDGTLAFSSSDGQRSFRVSGAAGGSRSILHGWDWVEPHCFQSRFGQVHLSPMPMDSFVA